MKEDEDVLKAVISVIKKEPKLVIFPIISIMLTILVLFTFLIPSSYLQGLSTIEFIKTLDIETFESALPIILLFIYYLISYLIIIYFNSALVACAYQLMNKKQVNIKHGFNVVHKNIGKILLWSVVSATIGVVLKYMRDHSKSIVQLIFSAVADIAWSLLTYFVIPVMIIENLDLIKSIRKSGSIFRKTWGENFRARIILAAYLFVSLLPGLGLLIKGFMSESAFFIILGVILALIAIIVFSAIETILRTALYVYGSTGRVPLGFKDSSLKNVFRKA